MCSLRIISLLLTLGRKICAFNPKTIATAGHLTDSPSHGALGTEGTGGRPADGAHLFKHLSFICCAAFCL